MEHNTERFEAHFDKNRITYDRRSYETPTAITFFYILHHQMSQKLKLFNPFTDSSN